MPVVVGAIIGAISGVASVVGAIVGTIASVVGAVLAPIVSVISTVIGGITGFLGPLTSKLLSPLTSLADTLLAPITGHINVLGKEILGPVVAVRAAISSGVSDIHDAATGRLAPILIPVANTLRTIRTYVGGVENIITDGLQPVKEISDIVRSISTVKMSNTLLAGTQDILSVINPIPVKKYGLITSAITSTWRETVEAVTGLATITDDYFKVLKNEIDTVDDRLTQESETALAALTEQVDTTVASLEEGFTLRMDPVEIELAQVTRRLEDVPEFQQMMIKALG